eukprot:CAMPEP_0198303224 /NCGR_PEP_ID=MMETSP1449-20131203/56775_1 /TAXON_ID=420275 /ORGANISM="Attheya septentrionalis, Strain CCMP2084" /LENGTH=216 /DNA_ID=CAMNT_0044005711 /DNA_START=64 /DNA_END=714 /DNA_ORIENTATION=+
MQYFPRLLLLCAITSASGSAAEDVVADVLDTDTAAFSFADDDPIPTLIPESVIGESVTIYDAKAVWYNVGSNGASHDSDMILISPTSTGAFTNEPTDDGVPSGGSSYTGAPTMNPTSVPTISSADAIIGAPTIASTGTSVGSSTSTGASSNSIAIGIGGTPSTSCSGSSLCLTSIISATLVVISDWVLDSLLNFGLYPVDDVAYMMICSSWKSRSI